MTQYWNKWFYLTHRPESYLIMNRRGNICREDSNRSIFRANAIEFFLFNTHNFTGTLKNALTHSCHNRAVKWGFLENVLEENPSIRETFAPQVSKERKKFLLLRTQNTHPVEIDVKQVRWEHYSPPAAAPILHIRYGIKLWRLYKWYFGCKSQISSSRKMFSPVQCSTL